MELQEHSILPEKGLTSNQELEDDLAYKIIFGILVLIYMAALLTFFCKIFFNIFKIYAVENVPKVKNAKEKTGSKNMNYEENEGIDLSIDASEYDEEQSEEMKTDFNNQQDSKVEVKFKKVFHDCKLPSLATSGAAAYDLYSCT